MIKIAITIFISVTLLFLFQIATGYLISKDTKLKTTRITKSIVDATVLIHGACESELTIDPDYVEKVTGQKAYNLAEAYSNFADNYLALYLYLKHQKKPNYLILQVAPQELNKLIPDMLNSYRYANFVDDSVVYEILKKFDSHYAFYSNIPYLRFSYYNNFILQKNLRGLYLSLTNKSNNILENGFRAPTESDTLKDFSKLNLKIDKHEWDFEQEQYLRKIIEYCKKENIKIILYKLPIYQKHYNDNPFLKEYTFKINEIAKEYSIPYFTFDTSAITYNYHNYNAVNHFTKQGVTKFNKMLFNTINDSIFKK